MKLHVNELGSGARIAVLVHGGTGDSGTWFDTAPRLVELGYHVLMPDLRGHGDSPRADTYELESFGDDLVDTLPRDIEVIMGHSLGGRALSDAVGRLLPARAVYLDPGWRTNTDVNNKGRLPVRADGKPLTLDELRQINPKWSDAHSQQWLSSFAKFDRKILAPSGLKLPTYYPPVPPVVPSLVVLADNSRFVPPSEQVRLREGGYEVRTVVGSGHVLFADDLEGMFQAFQGWI